MKVKKFIMKGEGQQQGLLYAFIIMVVLLLLSFGFFGSAQGINLKNLILGNPTVGETITTVEGGTYEEQREIDLTLDKQPATATLVGCQIAKAIASDFIEHGESKRSTIDGIDSALVAHAPFQINWNPDTNSYWKSADLKDRDSDGDKQTDWDELAKACSDTGQLVDCPSNLDEACVAAQLKNIRVGTDRTAKICTGDSVVVAGGNNLKFGDNACKAKDDWTKCSDQCAGVDSIKSWKASGAEISGTSLTGLPSDVIRTNDKSFAENFPPECKVTGEKCQPKYEWSVYWDNKLKAYAIEIPRISQLENLEVKSASDLGKVLAAYFSAGDRTNLIGLEQPELRTVYRTTFSPSEDYPFNDFVYKDFIQNVEGKYWDISEKIEFCGNSCDTSVIPIINFNRKVFNKDGSEWSENSKIDDIWTKKNERKIRLIVGNSENGVLAPNTLLKKDHNYKVLLNRFRGPDYRKIIGEPSCGFGQYSAWCNDGKAHCGITEQCGALVSKCNDYECDAYDYYAPIDYSLTVIDLGPKASGESNA